MTAHVVFRASADPARCGSPLARIGGFVGDADYVPMLHASALDAAAQRLFLGLATGSSSFAVGIVDLATGKLEKVDAEDSSDGHQLVGMKFDAASGTLVGLASGADYASLYLVQLAPETGKWRVRTVPTAFPVVMGNAGSVSAFDAASGTLFALLAGIHYWFPLMFGRKVSEFWGKLSFWVIFIGFNITFFPMHFSGLLGMPRRIYQYDAGQGYDLFNAMMDAIKEEMVGYLFNVEVEVENGGQQVAAKGLTPTPAPAQNLRYTAADESGAAHSEGGTSRNAPCPCGSGKKYKRCHGGAN